MKEKTNVTIYDIAKKLNVSPSTVSRVMNHSTHPVKQEVRELILNEAKEMGYIPNREARNLKKRTSSTVGVILPSIENPYYPSIVRGIESVVGKRNQYLVFTSCDRSSQRTDYSIQHMIESNVQGIISLYLDEIPESLERYVKNGGKLLNVVSNNQAYPGAHTIFVDKVEECRQATDHLIQLGHRKIALLFNQLSNTIRTERLLGYQTALKDAGIAENEEFIYVYGRDVPITADPQEFANVGYLLAEAMLKRSPDVTAIVSMNDCMSLGILKAISEVHKTVPNDYSLVSFDDLIFADSIIPSLTTISIDKYSWGKQLANYYFQMIEDSSRQSLAVKEEEVLCPSELIVRSSTKRYKM